jgi:uncharacterized membrane protein YkoI
MFAKHFSLALFLASLLHMSCTTEKPTAPIAGQVAEQIACQQLANSHVTSVRQEIDLGRLLYKIIVQNDSTAKRVTVDAATARIIEVVDRTKELHEAVATGENVAESICPVVRAAAEETALKAVPGEVQRWKVLKENGRLVYKFGIAAAGGQSARVTVDACKQEVLAIERTPAEQGEGAPGAPRRH